MKKLIQIAKYSCVVISLTTLLVACQKENNEPGGDPNTASGRFSDHKTCNIITPPGGVNLNGYYTKYMNCSGIPVISNNEVPDEALKMADQTIDFMLQGLDNVKAAMIQSGSYYGLTYRAGTTFNEMPEISGQSETSGGYYDGAIGIAVSSADNMLCLEGNKSVGTNNCVHEIVHMMHLNGFNKIDQNFEPELKALYDNARQNGLWKNTYMMSNFLEYLAAGSTVYYGVIRQGPSGGDGWSNEIYTREGMKDYDPGLYAFFEKYFNTATDVPGCVQPTTNTNVNCVSTVTDIDGNVYNVVSIGSQCWMKENLKTSKFRDGTPIEQMTDHPSWENDWADATKPLFIYYDHKSTNNDKYGKLYNWLAVSDNRGICPDGWHVPTRAEWEQMIKQTGGIYDSKNIKATTGWNNNNNGNNSSGFTALPGGSMFGYGFRSEGSQAFYWTADREVTPFEMLRIGVIVNGSGVTEVGGHLPDNGFSCRCVKD